MKISVIVQWSSLGKGIGELRAGWVTNWFVSPGLKGYQDMRLLTGSAPCKRVTGSPYFSFLPMPFLTFCSI